MSLMVCENQQIILGAPGCGKTTKLLSIMEQEMSSGVSPERIAFVSFTKKAANEAAERACEKFGFKAESLPYFRTLHSLAYRQLGIEKKQVMGRQHYKQLGELLGVQFTGKYSEEGELPMGSTDGDQMLFLDSLARTRCVSLEQQYNETNPYIEWFVMKQFSDTLRQYKVDCNLLDYTDMLENYVREAITVPVDVAFIDEAQDLSSLQWMVVRSAFRHAKRVYVAGDDDQAIFRWSGANVKAFMSLGGNKTVLEQSYRLPSSVHALGRKIISRVPVRFDKQYSPRNEVGSVQYHNFLDSIDLREGKWMLLFRNAYMQAPLTALAKSQGVAYTTQHGSSINPSHASAIVTWERLRKGQAQRMGSIKNVYSMLRAGKDIVRGYKSKVDNFLDEDEWTMQDLRAKLGLLTDAPWHEALGGISDDAREYYRTILRRGGKLTDTPPVHISTIHGVKGGEADNVLILTDMAPKTYDAHLLNQDDEHRVFYVGVTRAKKNLHIIMPQTTRSYHV